MFRFDEERLVKIVDNYVGRLGKGFDDILDSFETGFDNVFDNLASTDRIAIGRLKLLKDTPTTVTIGAVLAGVPKEKVSVGVEGKTVTVSIAPADDDTATGKDKLRGKLMSTDTLRLWFMPDPTKTVATMKDGILEIVIEKLPTDNKATVNVQIS